MSEQYERDRAIKEGERIAAEDGYFGSRPNAASIVNAQIFRDGFDRGWYRRASQPALAQGDEPVIDIAFIEQVGDRIGYQSSAWDCVDAAELIKAVIATYHEEKTLSAQREQPQVTPADGEPDKELWVLRYKSASGVESYLCSNAPAKMQHRYVLAEQPQGVVVPIMTEVERILSGIDREDDTDGGWWETSTGAEFGREKLEELRALLGQREG